MLEYRFYTNQIGTPQFDIKGELHVLNELGSCSREYLAEIITSLEQILQGKLEQYDFGYEVYNFDCTKDECKVLNTFEGWKVEYIIPTEEIYRLLGDWRDYLIDWEKSKN